MKRIQYLGTAIIGLFFLFKAFVFLFSGDIEQQENVGFCLLIAFIFLILTNSIIDESNDANTLSISRLKLFSKLNIFKSK